MDLKTRKLKAIEFLVSTHDEEVISKIETAINESQKINKNRIKPFTQKELVARAKKSNDDYKNGRFKSQNELEIDSENW